MPFPAVRANGTITDSVSAITPAIPAGAIAGDLLILFLETGNQAITIASPSGWTEAPNSPSNTAAADATRLTVFWKIYDGVETDPTTSDSGDHQIGRIMAFAFVNKGADWTSSPFDVTTKSNDTVVDTNLSFPSVTTTQPETMIILAAVTGFDQAGVTTAEYSGWTNSNLSSLTERVDNGRIVGNGGTLGIATGGWAATGAIGTTTGTLANADVKCMWVAAIKGATAPIPNNYHFPDASSSNTGIISVTEKIR